MTRKREYYKPPFGTGKDYTWGFMLMFFLPTVALILAMALIIEFGPEQVWLRILSVPLGFALFFGWIVLFGKLMDKNYGKKFRLKIPNADRYVHVTPLTDEAVLDELDRKGAFLFFHEPDEGFKKFTYNLFHDYGLVEPPKELNFYAVSREMFLEHFAYYESKYYRYEEIYVMPYDVIGADNEKFKALRKETIMFCYYADFTELCDGIVSVPDYGIWYRYKDLRRGDRTGSQ